MGYRTVTTELLGLIWSQLAMGESNRAIARNLALDRKTVNAYAAKIKSSAIPLGTSYQDALSLLGEFVSGAGKKKPGLVLSHWKARFESSSPEIGERASCP